MLIAKLLLLLCKFYIVEDVNVTSCKREARLTQRYLDGRTESLRPTILAGTTSIVHGSKRLRQLVDTQLQAICLRCLKLNKKNSATSSFTRGRDQTLISKSVHNKLYQADITWTVLLSNIHLQKSEILK